MHKTEKWRSAIRDFVMTSMGARYTDKMNGRAGEASDIDSKSKSRIKYAFLTMVSSVIVYF